MDVRTIRTVGMKAPDFGVVTVPASKSYTNRALIISTLADGVSRIRNSSTADDSRLMIEALRKFGIVIEEMEIELVVHGKGGKMNSPETEIYVGNAGTTMRFLVGFAALANGVTVLTGDNRMNERPISGLTKALNQLGVDIESNNGYPPLNIYGGKIKGGAINIEANVSSQFISSVLMIAPYAESDITLKLTGKVYSKPYIEMTLDVMRAFDVEVEQADNVYFVRSEHRYKPCNYTIENDASSASYFFGAAATTGGKIKVANLSSNSKQADIKFLDVLKKMGCEVISEPDGITVIGNKLIGVDVDMSDMPDVVPTLAVVAVFAEGKTTIRNVAHLRYKESDRLNALATELRKLGAQVIELDDGLEITSGKLSGSEIETYNDHRIAMSFAIAGLRVPNISILNPACVKKSFPDFWEEWEKVEGSR
ncbi:MAG: 3-phosphoshikimate 1-carboxyvinyltransferase [Bacteroidota bacterium]|nr:3-phosphoshikimate 1-carboxyvinyltransferase [Bacteroidota bacterium]